MVSDFREWRRLRVDPHHFAPFTSMGADMAAQLEFVESQLADLALVSAVAKPLTARSEQDSDGFRVRSSLNDLHTALHEEFFLLVTSYI